MSYTAGYSAHVVKLLSQRTADSHVAFVLPLLRPGMKLIDCGCGPGSITLDLAAAVAPGEVVGLDESEELLTAARSAAAQRGLTNVRFVRGDIRSIPFADVSFDAAIAHAVLQHLPDPLTAVREMRRVLVDGGVIGVRDADHGAVLLEPRPDELDRAMDLWERLWKKNGGDPAIGRKQRSLLRQAGFREVHASASFECCGSTMEAKGLAEHMAYQFGESANANRLIALGWADRSQLDRISQAWRDWAVDPDAFFARARCEAVAMK